MDFAIPADYKVKIKEHETKDKSLDIARELKNMEHESDDDTNWYLRKVPKGFIRRLGELGIGGRAETIQTTVLLRSVRKLRRVLETWKDWLLLKLLRKTINKRWFEKLVRTNIITTLLGKHQNT